MSLEEQQLQQDVTSWVAREQERDATRFAQLYPALKARTPAPESNVILNPFAGPRPLAVCLEAGPGVATFTECGLTWLQLFEAGRVAKPNHAGDDLCFRCYEARRRRSHPPGAPPAEVLARMKATWVELRAEDVRPTHRLLVSRLVLRKMAERGEDPAKVFGLLQVVAADEALWLLVDLASPHLSRHARLRWHQRPGDRPNIASDVRLEVSELPAQRGSGA